MPDIEFKLTGFDELQRKLEQMPKAAARQALKTGTLAAAAIWQREMEATVRRGPHHYSDKAKRFARGKGVELAEVFGFIASHIRVRAVVTTDFEANVAVGPSKGGFWAKFLEFGQRGHAFPFIRPAFEARKNDVLEEFGIETKAAIVRAGLPLS